MGRAGLAPAGISVYKYSMQERTGESGYAELHALSNFSFLRGASHPQELVARAAALGYEALALTDECSVAGVVRAHVAAKRCGLELIVGSELCLDDGLRLVLLACNREGYAELCRLITLARRRSAKGGYRLGREDLAGGAPECLVLYLPGRAAAERALEAEAAWIARCFAGRAWIAVELFLEAGDAARLARLQRLGERSGLPLAAAGDVHMHCPERQALQDTVTAIRLGLPLAGAGFALFPNAERCLRPRRRLARLYPPALLAETQAIAARCRFSLDELRYEYPEELVPAGHTPASYLRALTEQGLARRWPGAAPARVRSLVEHELALIGELGYEPFFLTVHDVVRFARSRGILCQGRGSAANSAVCYALGITEVDPARMELLFERFISRERNEPPDIDVDFEHERREEVIQYVYRKYGRERAALAATVITYRAKSAVRDVGKALGMNLEQVDRLARSLYWWDGHGLEPERLREAGLDPDSPVIGRLVALVAELEGFPRHLSQHVGGFVIARDSLARLVPVENAAMAERTVIQWDKDDLAELGLLKVDCLCLGMLSAIRRALDLIAASGGPRLALADIPAEDEATYAMIRAADTVGVFQIESRAQMSMLPRLKPACFYDLVIEVAIIRPGPIQGEMVHPYLRRREGLEPVVFPSEEVRSVLERTLGVPLFQEQVIKLAMVAAGFSPGEAERLRRSMATWKKNGGIAEFEQRLVEGMRERGYEERFARQLYQQILGFGEYGFPESHSASFALLAYVSAWLKCHAPAAFTAALLNSQPMGFYSPSQLVQDAQRHGVEVLPVDVDHSDWDCTLEPKAAPASPPRAEPVPAAVRDSDAAQALRLGLRMVKGLSEAAAARLVAARPAGGWDHVARLARQARLDRGDLEALAAAGALAGLAGNRHLARWQILGVERPLALQAAAGGSALQVEAQRAAGAGGVPAPPPAAPAGEGDGEHLAAAGQALPMLRPPAEGEGIVADYASLGLSLGRHPLAVLRERLDALGFLRAADLAACRHGEPVRLAGLVVTRQRPGTATGVVFVTLEDETGNSNLIVWSTLVEAQRRELLGARLLGVDGELQREGEVLHVIAHRLEDHSGLLGRLAVPSRDFH